MEKYYPISAIPYERKSVERILTGFNDLDYYIKGIEFGITLLVANTNCVDCDTEYFNGSEWKKISEYKKGDKVLQYNQDGSAELVLPLKYHKTTCENLTLFRNSRGSINQCLSDNHSLVYMNKHTKKVEKIPFIEVKNNINSIKYKGQIITAFNYDSYGNYNIDENVIRLMVAISAEGHFPKHIKTNYCRINLKHKYKKERLEYLLNACNIEYKKKNTCPKDVEFSTYTFQAPFKFKEFPKEWYSLPKKCFEVIFDEIFNWDGKDTISDRCYRTTSKSNADFIQFVFTGLGYRASIKCDNRIGSRTTNGYTRKSICYTIRCSHNDCYISLQSSAKLTIEDYKTKDGYMYCFTVPSGMLVLRRDGAINITGNCGKSTFVQGVLSKAIEQGYKAWVFSGEHTAQSFLQLLYHQNSTKKDYEPIAYKDYRGNDTNIADWYVKEEQEQRIRRKFNNNLFIYSNKAKRDIDTMLDSMKECYEKEGARFFLIDNLISIDNISSNVFAEQTRITEAIRTFALNHKVFVLLVAHQRKIAERGFLIDIQDVAGSQNISNKAYNVIAQYRTDMLNKDSKDYAQLTQELARCGFDINQCDGVLAVLKTKGNSNGYVGIVYDKETKTYKQAPKISQTEADKIFKRVIKQQTFANSIDIGGYGLDGSYSHPNTSEELPF